MKETKTYTIWTKEPDSIVLHDVVTDINKAYDIQRKQVSVYKRQQLEYGVFIDVVNS